MKSVLTKDYIWLLDCGTTCLLCAYWLTDTNESDFRYSNFLLTDKTFYFILVSIEAIQSVLKKYGSSIPGPIVMLQLSFLIVIRLTIQQLHHLPICSMWICHQSGKGRKLLKEKEKKKPGGQCQADCGFLSKACECPCVHKKCWLHAVNVYLVDSERTVWENTLNCCKIYVHLLVLCNR